MRIFLVAFLKFPLSANDFPIKLDCTDEVCDCYRVEGNTFKIEKIIDTIDKGLIKDSTLIACCYHQLAIEYYYEFDDDLNSLKYNKKANEIRKVNNDGLLWRTNLNIGINYYNLNEYKQASLHFDEALKLPGEKDALDSLFIFINLAECYLEIGDLDNAISFASKSIQFEVDQVEKNSALNVYSFILISSKDSLNLVKAIENGVKTLALCKSNEDYKNMEGALNNLGDASLNLNSIDRAITYFNDAFEIPNQSDTINKAALLNNLANAFYDKNEFNLAINTLKKSYNLLCIYYETNYNYDYASSYENLADNYTALYEFDTALLCYQKSLINLTNNFRIENIQQNPNPKDRSLFIYSNPDIIRVLHLKATAVFKHYQQNKNQKYLTLANQTYQTAFDFHDKLQKEISTENSRLFQAKNIVPYIENALKVAHQQQENGQDISKATFRFMEKNKATVLLQSMNEANALQFAKLPGSLLEQEKELKIALTFYKKQLNDAIEDEDTAKIDRLENLEFETKQIYDRLIDNLETNYSDYYELKYQQNQVQLTDLQNLLDDKTAILEYFVGNSSIFVLSIENDQSKLYKFNIPENWGNIINDYKNSINPEEDEYTDKLFKSFTKNAHLLYQNLLQIPLADLGKSITNIQIIPDAELNAIPFELLLTEKVDKTEVDYINLPYLLQEKTISYTYSGALLIENMNKAQETNPYNYAGFAPSYKYKTYKNLHYGSSNTKNIAKLLNGKSYVDDKVTKAIFKKEVDQYKIFHLAMHGILNNDNPLSSKLIFSNIDYSDYELHAYELYNMKIPAQLGLLSACETGAGFDQRGEGIMSLSRAFTYAGCNSLVMSLWSIDDEATANIVKSFFENLKSGENKNKDEALRKAKLDYLNAARSDKTHPKYWAGLVLSGNTSTIEFEIKSEFSNFWWFIILVFFVGLWIHLKHKQFKAFFQKKIDKQISINN